MESRSINMTPKVFTASVVSYSKDYQREAGILKIEFFSKKQNPSRRRYSRYEEAYLQSTKSQHYKLAAG